MKVVSVKLSAGHLLLGKPNNRSAQHAMVPGKVMKSQD